MIPCNNCLILPICRYKQEIKCNILFKWWIDKKGKGKWERLSKYVPNVKCIGNDERARFSRNLWIGGGDFIKR